MLKSIFTKTIFERRLSTIVWFIALMLYTVLVILFFPVLKDSFGASLKDVPESLQKLLGSAADYQTLTGYVDIQVISQIVFLTLIEGVLIGVSLLAGDENAGTLQTLLAYPVSRTKVYLHKFAAMLLISAFIIIVGVTFGVLIGEIIVEGSVSFVRLIEATFMAWLVTAFFASFAFSLGAITGKRSVAGGVAGVYAFVSYTITSLASTASTLKTIDYISPFHYFNTPSVIKEGMSVLNVLILAGGILALGTIGLVVFIRRDIYSR
jgi:ABC-2 type transport system permease protein